MEKVLTAKQISVMDRSSIEDFHIPEPVLVENAAMALADALAIGETSKVQIICGKGNNGADGFALGRQLVNRGLREVTCIQVYGQLGVECLRQKEMAVSCGVRVGDLAIYDERSDLTVDALYGSGYHPPMDDEGRAVISLLSHNRNVVSVDLPSGLSDNSPMDAESVKARFTITFGALKTCQLTPLGSAKVSSGPRPLVRNPGFPRKLLESAPADCFLMDISDSTLGHLPANAFKGTRGHVGIFSGTERMCGAAVLAGLSAFHAGAGLVSILQKPGERRFFDYPQLMVGSYDDDLRRYDGVGFGNGIDVGDPGSPEVLRRVLEADRPTVLDAGALRLLPGLGEPVPRTRPLILTPHVGELRALAGRETSNLSTVEYVTLVRELARRWNAVVVIKANVTWVVSPSSDIRILWGNLSSLGVAGSGDVLCGIIATFLAQGQDAMDAACNGVLTHYEAGRHAQEKGGFHDSLTLASFVEVPV